MSITTTRLENWMQKPVVRLGLNAALLFGWAWMFRAVFPYLGIIFTQQEFRTNQILLLGVLLLIGMQIRKGAWRIELAAQPHLYRPAVSLLLGSAALFLIAERYLDINTLSASLFGLAGYAILGLYTSPPRWRQGLPAALLLIGALPFGEHMQTFIGYPVRMFTAGAVRAGLAAAGVPVGTAETILVFENGLTQVDLPCSGVKSLWTGGLFLLAATWIEGRPITRRWVLAALAFAALLLAANLARVAVLVVVGQVLDWRLAAEMLHVPLGVLGFVLACAAAMAMLRWASPSATQPDDLAQASSARSPSHPAWLAPLLGGLLLVLGLLYTPKLQPAAAQTLPQWQFTPGLALDPWEFTPEELQWLLGEGVESVERWRFDWRGQSGSLLLSRASSWRAQHRPEACFQVYGLTIENSFAYLAGPEFPVRLVSLGGDSQKSIFSAAYWFQSGSTVTDDYAARMWADLSPQTQSWVLVTVLFDRPIDLQGTDALNLFTALYNDIQRSMEGGLVP